MNVIKVSDCYYDFDILGSLMLHEDIVDYVDVRFKSCGSLMRLFDNIREGLTLSYIAMDQYSHVGFMICEKKGMGRGECHIGFIRGYNGCSAVEKAEEMAHKEGVTELIGNIPHNNRLARLFASRCGYECLGRNSDDYFWNDNFEKIETVRYYKNLED